MFFDVHNKGITTKLVEKIGREKPGGQPSVMFIQFLYDCI